MFRRSKTPADQVLPDAAADPPPAADLATVTDASFLDDTGGAVAIVDFWAPWCGPCRAFSPMFNDLASRRSRSDFRFGACNVDENPQTSSMVGIQSIPSVVAFDAEGNEVGRLVGVPSRRQLEALVEQAEAAR